MRKWISVVSIALAMVLGSYAMAKDSDAGAKPMHGKVTAVTKDSAGAKIVSITISSHAKVKGDPPVETVITVDESTKVTKGADAMTLADLAVGTLVNVTADESKKASAIEIRVPKKKPADAAK